MERVLESGCQVLSAARSPVHLCSVYQLMALEKGCFRIMKIVVRVSDQIYQLTLGLVFRAWPFRGGYLPFISGADSLFAGNSMEYFTWVSSGNLAAKQSKMSTRALSRGLTPRHDRLLCFKTGFQLLIWIFNKILCLQ